MFLIWIFVLVGSQFSSAIILRPKWFPYFARANQERAGTDSAPVYDSGRTSEALTARQARTVDLVDLERDTFRASHQFPAYVHTVRSGLLDSSSTRRRSDFDLGRNSRSGLEGSWGNSRSSVWNRSASGRNVIPRCDGGQTRHECLNRMLALLAQMLDLERERRAAG
ncbi:hypothetical protein EGW08_005108 [Elysia chlorotica]|uniref:Uncharacterized protein n=1 Tax=Elysia chlorotica TaxID=188477 RepID=A0A433U042_ELYCH|nr:hypothetical protein EGW08_005108 [Elysia chlorotica]